MSNFISCNSIFYLQVKEVMCLWKVHDTTEIHSKAFVSGHHVHTLHTIAVPYLKPVGKLCFNLLVMAQLCFTVIYGFWFRS